MLGDEFMVKRNINMNLLLASSSDRNKPTAKRDRPLSSYFDSPTEELDDLFKLGEEDCLPLLNKRDKQHLKESDLKHLQLHPINKHDEKSGPNESPLINRKPLKSLTNFVNNFEFPMKSKFSSKRNLMSLVARRSHQEFDRLFSREKSEVSLDDTFDGDTTLNDDDINLPEPKSKAENSSNSSNQEKTSNPLSSHPLSASRNLSSVQPKPNPSTSALRRIHSMYHTPKEKENMLMDEDNAHLPHTSINTFRVSNDLLPRINGAEMCKILDGAYNDEFDEFIVVDCRFSYEFKGGHIQGSWNISSQKDLEEKFINSLELHSPSKKLIIFHCEFSVFRGPTMALHLRKCDRILNRDNYPLLSFPDVVVLEGGYKTFYDVYKHHCFPQGYIEMKDVNYEKHCEEELDKVRQDNKLTRARSYNFTSSHHTSTMSLPASSLSNHNRSSSYTTVTSHAENLKILKRQRSSSTVRPLDENRSRSSLSYMTSPKLSSSSLCDDDFHPPSALFRSNSIVSRPSLSTNTSLASVNSTLSMSSDTYSAFSSSDSLAGDDETDYTDYFDSVKASSLASATMPNLHPMVKKPSGPVPQLPKKQIPFLNEKSNSTTTVTSKPLLVQNSVNLPNTSFKFPVVKTKNSNHSLSRINTTLLNSSPIVSSPLLTATPISTIDSTVSNRTLSLIDPINDSAVDFNVPYSHDTGGTLGLAKTYNSRSFRYNHSRKRSGSLLGSAGGGLYNFLSLDIDEVEEEDC